MTRHRIRTRRRPTPWLLPSVLVLAVAVAGAATWVGTSGALGGGTRAPLASEADGGASAATAGDTAADPASSDAGSSAAMPPEAPAHPASDRARLLAAAYSLRGVPYKWGGKTAKALDCSGFTKLAYARIGVRLPDGSFNQEQHAHRLTSAVQLKPGDLVFYRWRAGQSVQHVTMYAGDGWLIGTGSPGQLPQVSVFPLADDMPNDGRVLTYRHIVLADER